MNQTAENVKPITKPRKTKKYIPDACGVDQFGNEPTIKGFVTIFIPNHEQRMDIIGKSKATEEGNEAKIMANVVKLIEPYIKSVEIINEEGEKLTTYAELYDDLQGGTVLGEIATCFLSGSFIKKKFEMKS